MRICPKCHQNLSLEFFSKSSIRKSGYACHCKACDKQRRATRHAANPELEKAKGRNRMSRWRNASPQNWEKARLQSLKWHRANKEKTKEANLEWRKNNPEKVRLYDTNKHLKSKYGITLAKYNYLHKLQNGVCSICLKANNNRRLVVDHCHATGKVRGLLCTPCNTGIGQLKDSPSLLRKAAEYLDNAKNKK